MSLVNRIVAISLQSLSPVFDEKLPIQQIMLIEGKDSFNLEIEKNYEQGYAELQLQNLDYLLVQRIGNQTKPLGSRPSLILDNF